MEILTTVISTWQIVNNGRFDYRVYKGIRLNLGKQTKMIYFRDPFDHIEVRSFLKQLGG